MSNVIVHRAIAAWETLTARLRGVGETLPPLIMRIVMGWEFFEAGREKLGGTNWFADIQDKFPVPFNFVPANLSWGMATWFELIGGIALWIGFGTRFFAFSLLVLTFVATAAVHWPDMFSMWSDLLKGYSIEQRIYHLQMNPDRADVIIPASNIYIKVMEWARANSILVPEVGLKDGIMLQLYEANVLQKKIEF